MNVVYEVNNEEKTVEVSNFYKDVAQLLVKEDVSAGPKQISVSVPNIGHVSYRVSLRSGTRMIAELCNDLSNILLQDSLTPCFLTSVKPEKNAYKYYKLTPEKDTVLAEYGRMGTNKGELFGARTYRYPKSMFWVKYFEKLSKGYVDRSTLYLSEEPQMEKENVAPANVSPASISAKLFEKLRSLAKVAVREAKVAVPITAAILKESKRILNQMYAASTVEQFNDLVLELISILQRPVRTGDGSGVKRLLAESETDFARIIQRESDLIQAMEGSYSGNAVTTVEDGFTKHKVEVYLATEKQKQQVMSHLSDTLKGKVKNVYRVIPTEQQQRFDAYLKKNNIKKVKQLWHGSRNQNWLSIILNSLKLNPDAIITGKMFGNGIYFAPSSMKSWNYTSYRGTSWARGNADVAFMGLYAVAYGKPYDVNTWSASTNYKKMTTDNDCNCLHAHAGSALMNDEIIFYHEDAMVLNYIVEFE